MPILPVVISDNTWSHKETWYSQQKRVECDLHSFKPKVMTFAVLLCYPLYELSNKGRIAFMDIDMNCWVHLQQEEENQRYEKRLSSVLWCCLEWILMTQLCYRQIWDVDWKIKYFRGLAPKVQCMTWSLTSYTEMVEMRLKKKKEAPVYLKNIAHMSLYHWWAEVEACCIWYTDIVSSSSSSSKNWSMQHSQSTVGF